MRKYILPLLLLVFGVFIVAFGEVDDSPGGQVLGLVAIGMAIYFFLKLVRSKNDKTDKK